MKTKHSIVAMTSDVDTESTLRLVFGADGRIGEMQIHRTLDALAAALERVLTPLVLVDIEPDPSGLLERLESIVNRFPSTKFIVLAREPANNLVLLAMGVRHVQIKGRIPAELPGVIQRVLATVSIAGRLAGSVVTVLSAGGGAGATTLAVNLANELQLTTLDPVLIVDLDYAYGAVATYLELEGKYGVADVLTYDGVIDADLIETTSVRYSDRIRALLSPANVNFGKHGNIHEARLGETIHACKVRHRFTIFDAPRLSMDAAATLASESEMILILLQPVVKDIRVTRSMIQALLDREVPADRIKPIFNRYRKHREIISIEEAQKTFGGIAPECLSNDYVSAINGNNYGKLLANSAPRSALRKDLMKLASQCSALNELRNGELEKTAIRRLTA